MKVRKILLFTMPFIMVLLSLPIFFTSCATVGIEKVQYDVLEKSGRCEVREYKPYLVAETRVDSDFKEAANKTNESIAMTAPVTQQATGGKYAVSFVMPSEYTLETLPQPTDETVVIKEVPGGKAAVIRYSGTWSQKRYEEKKAALETYLQENGLTASGEPIWAGYDPPFQLWFLRRNEVLIPIE